MSRHPHLQRLHDTAATLGLLAGALRDHGTARGEAQADILDEAGRLILVLFAPGQRCPGRMRNGPDKSYTRCRLCGRVDYETNEGDPCPFDACDDDDDPDGEGRAGQCPACREFFAAFRCGKAEHLECDCPRCQGLCSCARE